MITDLVAMIDTARSIVHGWMDHLGFTAEQIAEGEAPRDHSGCELTELGWDCDPEEGGEERHPIHDEMDNTAALVMFTLEALAGRLREHVVTALTDVEVEELLAAHPLDHLWGQALDASRSLDFRGGDEDGDLDEDVYLRYRRRALDRAYADVLADLVVDGRLLPEGGTERVEWGLLDLLSGDCTVCETCEEAEGSSRAALHHGLPRAPVVASRTVTTFPDGSVLTGAWAEVTE